MLKKLFKLNMFVLSLTLLFSISHVNADSHNVTVEGDSTRFVTGDAHATLVEVAGYDSRNRKLYLNLEFTSNKDPANSITYSVKVFNGSSEVIGSISPPVLTAGAGGVFKASPTIDITSPSLTAAYRIVVTVESSN
ncbi:hypothetical protein V1502_01750 [Bacillus sp. SCS-153A]|uniref:hypothetical protein n=1 Tax=Rossellomorea sedimentorum TaxID=3115294 RepID=UPI003906C11F